MSNPPESRITSICPMVEFINDQNRLNGFLLDDDDDDDDDDYDDDDGNDENSSTAHSSSFDDGDDAIIDAVTLSFDHIFVDHNDSDSSLCSTAQSINNSKKNNTTDIAIDSTITSTNSNRKPLFDRLLFSIRQKMKQMTERRKKE